MYLGEKLIVRINGKSSLRINEVLSHTQHIKQLPQQDSAHSTFSTMLWTLPLITPFCIKLLVQMLESMQIA